MTEDGKPVSNLSVLSAASAEGIGTVLLIDSSNSMKGSIDAAMQAARAFAARNPGQPLSVVFFNQKPNVALPLTTDRAKVTAVLAKPPKLAEGTRIYDALAAAVAQVRGSALGAARIVLLSDGDDVGSRTSLDSALQQLEAQRIRVFTVGIQSPDFTSDDLEAHRRRDGWLLRGGKLRRRAHEGLRRARLPARQRVPPALPLDGETRRRTSTSTSRSPVRRPSRSSYTTPNTGTAAPFEPAFRDELLQSLAPRSAVGRRRSPARRSSRSAPSSAFAATRSSSRAWASSSRFRSRSARRRAARRSTSFSRPSARRSSSVATGGGWRDSRRTSTSRRSASIPTRMIWALRARRLARRGRGRRARPARSGS